jgi:penicillin-binding protein-related factor A (putative recombinase)
MAVNKGKSFEGIVREAFEQVPDTIVYRLNDSMSGFKGVKTPCDFFVYHRPILYAIECKSTNNPSLPFTNITEFQWTHLLRMAEVTGVVAGILCWYTNYDRTIFIPIHFLETLKQNGAKSIRYDADDPAIIDIRGKKKRVFWTYDMNSLFLSIEQMISDIIKEKRK